METIYLFKVGNYIFASRYNPYNDAIKSFKSENINRDLNRIWAYISFGVIPENNPNYTEHIIEAAEDLTKPNSMRLKLFNERLEKTGIHID